MKNFKFLLCSIFILSCYFTVTANSFSFEKIKIEVLKNGVTKFTPVDYVSDFNINAPSILAIDFVLQKQSSSINHFAIINDDFFDLFIYNNQSSFYREKLNKSIIIDKKNLLIKTGIKFTRFYC